MEKSADRQLDAASIGRLLRIGAVHKSPSRRLKEIGKPKIPGDFLSDAERHHSIHQFFRDRGTDTNGHGRKAGNNGAQYLVVVYAKWAPEVKLFPTQIVENHPAEIDSCQQVS